MRVTVERVAGRRLEARSRGARLVVDRTVEEGGPGDGFRSGELLLAALGSCIAGTMLAFAENQGLELGEVRIELEDEAADAPKRITAIRATIGIGGGLDDATLSRLHRVASRCKISNTLASAPTVETRIVRLGPQPAEAELPHPPLVSPDWLEAQLGDPQVKIVEISFDPAAKAAYFDSHLPGSAFRYWKDFCWDERERRFPPGEEMSRRLGGLGVSEGDVLVLVGDPLQFATYAYWVLWMAGLGHAARVLDGGRRTWVEQGRPLTDEEVEPEAVPGPSPRPVESQAVRVGRDEVLSRLGDPRTALLDLRSPEEFRGERVAPVTAPFDHGAERGGHIPGARHLHFERLLAPDGTFRPPAEMREQLAAIGVEGTEEIVTYCRLSHRATLGWFALTLLAGVEGVRVYDGSWTEWGSMVGMPIER